ncbi:MAG: excinuclease ABC subunit UvrC, partial [Chitinivibrionales bacterium]
MEKVNIRGISEKVTTESLKHFPRSSGVYIMKNQKGQVLYIGKALNLKSRVSSYFLQGERRFQLPFLMEKVHSIEYIVTNNENEALILEANLIREEKPPYNFELKDDKHYPYLKITAEEDFPRLIVTRSVRNDMGDYFGPYTESGNMNRLRRLILKLFRIRTCRKLRNRDRPCINYSMGRCSAPCAGYITPEEYMERIRAVKRFLRGRHKEAVEILRGMMNRAASVHAYERCAEIRDSINLIESRGGGQSVDLCSPDTGFDVFGVDTQGVSVSVCVLRFRNGVLISRRSFLIKREVWEASS